MRSWGRSPIGTLVWCLTADEVVGCAGKALVVVGGRGWVGL